MVGKVGQHLLPCPLGIAGQEQVDHSPDSPWAAGARLGPALEVVPVQIPVQAKQADAEGPRPAGAAGPLVPEPDRELRLHRRRPQRTLGE
jgi:hypothetical protein